MLVASAVAVIAVGCGPAPGAGSFSSDGYPFSFNYPSSWTLSQSRAAGADHGTVTVALREPLDQIQLTSFTLKKAIPKGKTGMPSEVDAIVRRIAKQADTAPRKRRAVEYGGANGYQYTVTYPANERVELESRLTILFAGKTQILVSCQSTAENRAKLIEGCNEILESLKYD